MEGDPFPTLYIKGYATDHKPKRKAPVERTEHSFPKCKCLSESYLLSQFQNDHNYEQGASMVEEMQSGAKQTHTERYNSSCIVQPSESYNHSDEIYKSSGYSIADLKNEHSYASNHNVSNSSLPCVNDRCKDIIHTLMEHIQKLELELKVANQKILDYEIKQIKQETQPQIGLDDIKNSDQLVT